MNDTFIGLFVLVMMSVFIGDECGIKPQIVCTLIALVSFFTISPTVALLGMLMAHILLYEFKYVYLDVYPVYTNLVKRLVTKWKR